MPYILYGTNFSPSNIASIVIFCLYITILCKFYDYNFAHHILCVMPLDLLTYTAHLPLYVKYIMLIILFQLKTMIVIPDICSDNNTKVVLMQA